MKNLLKKVIVLVITGAVVWGVAGCGRGSEQQREKREFYYVPSYVDLELDVTYIQRSLAIGNQLYLIGEKWDDVTGESSTTLYCYQLDTGKQSKVDMEMSENSSISQMAANSKGNMVMIVQTYEPIYEDDDVSAGEEDGDTAADDAEEDSVPEDSDGATAVISGSSSATFVVSESVSETVAVSGDDEVRMPIDYRHELELWEVSPSDGTVLNKTDIKPVFDDPDSTWVQYMELDSQDNIYLSCDNCIYLLDMTGQKKGTINFDNWIYNMFMIGDGTVYVQYYGETGMETKPVDAQKLALGDAVEIEGDNGMRGTFYQGVDGRMIIHQSDSVYAYDFESGAKEELFSWLDADINSDEVENMGQISDDRFWALTRSWMSGDSEYSLAILTKTPAAEVTEKAELVFGTMWLSQDMRTSIIDFNKSNENYRITVEEYASDDYYSGLTRFNNDLTSGNSPDIIDISNISFSQYASKGVFEDLYPYMERDGIDAEDYLPNILKAYEVDGKLYGVMPQFYITTTMAKASNVGDVTGWTVDEMLDFAESHETANLFDYGARSSILYYCVYNNIDEYIDWETGKCSFNSDDFIRVLEFARKFPEEVNYEDRGGTSASLRSDKILLMQYSLSSVQEFQMLTGLYGEKVAFVGYPNSERKSNLIQPTNGSAAISSKSKHKDGAWEFVKVFISEEYQNNLVDNHHNWGFPILKDALDKLFEQDMTPEYYEDAEGNQIERPKTTWGWDDFDMEIYAATPAEIDAVRAVIESADRLSGSINEELTNIITEETEPFFKDQKSAQETADIIQNRIQTYVNENS